ncbi:hypothetical protein [uncultured Mediterranean phage uvMED]|nr:hypothetical protein [uncultured Mediterranean phage uvMED]
MTFPILGGNGAVAGAFSIDNSLRLNDDDTPKLAITPNASNRKTWTFSAWVKRSSLSSNQRILSITGTNDFLLRFRGDDKLSFIDGSITSELITATKVFRDTSAWYHIVIVLDTTQGTASNRAKLYVNGYQETDLVNNSGGSASYPSQNADGLINSNVLHTVGCRDISGTVDQNVDGYMAEVHLIDGTAKAPTDFGEFDEDSGIWKPIRYSGSYGTNGFKLNFSDSGSLGADSSGNGNNFTATNLASTDQTTDTPQNNFATMNPLGTNNIATHSEGNTKLTTGDGASISGATIPMTQGKWYAEFICTAKTSVNMNVGIVRADTFDGDNQMDEGNNVGYMFQNTGDIFHGGANESYGASWAVDDVIGIAFNADNLNVEFFKNGVGQGNYTRIASENSGGDWIMCVGEGQGSGTTATFECNFGNPPSSVSSGNADGNGYGNFEYAPPSGYLALCSQNLATELSPTIDDGSAYFQTAIWTGTGSSQTITNDGNSDLQPDFVWIKCRSVSRDHVLLDSTRGGTKVLSSNSSSAEATDGAITSFNTDGFTHSGQNAYGGNGETHVGWQWKANGGTTSSNTDGSITSTVQANTTAGFSIVTYTGTGSNATVGHGLSKAPEIIIVKNRDYSPSDWQTGSDYLTSWAYRLKLNGTNAEASVTSSFNSTAPTSTVINIGNNDDVNRSGNSHLIYAFHSVEGYSKIGKYTGNGNADGTFVYTGFKPAWVMIKRTDASGDNWVICDNKRDTFNVMENILLPNTSSAEFDETSFDFVSNGFKLRQSAGTYNASGGTIIYMAFAENPFVDSNGVPVTAR